MLDAGLALRPGYVPADSLTLQGACMAQIQRVRPLTDRVLTPDVRLCHRWPRGSQPVQGHLPGEGAKPGATAGADMKMPADYEVSAARLVACPWPTLAASACVSMLW